MGLFSKKKGRLSSKWQYDVRSNLLAGPMVYDVDKNGAKEIVFGTKDGRVIMLDDSSETKWEYDVKEEMGEMESFFHDTETGNSIAAAPMIGDIDHDGHNEVIFGTEMGIIYVLDRNGMIVWKFRAAAAIRSSVILHDVNNDNLMEIIFGCMDGSIYVLSAQGQLLWKFDAGAPIEGSPCLIPDTKKLLFGCHDGSIKCIDLWNDHLLWTFQTEGKVVAQPVVADIFNDNRMHVIVGSTDYHLYVLNEQGDLTWKYKTEGALLSRVAVDDINQDGKKEIVVGSCDNNVYALSSKGDKIWSYETYFWVVAPPLIEDIDGDGKKEVIVGSYDHNVYVLDSEGVYSLDYVPGLGGVVNQAGHYSEFMTREPGKVQAKKIWQFNTHGFIVGCGLNQDAKSIVVNIKEGKVEDLVHVE